MSGQITNPGGLLGQDASYYAETTYYKAAGTIAKYEVVAFTAPGTVEQLDVSDALPELIAGVAQEAGVAGDYILVVTRGHTIVQVAAGDTPALGLPLAIGVADGDAAVAAASDATTVAGDVIGVCLGAEIGTSATCWAFIERF